MNRTVDLGGMLCVNLVRRAREPDMILAFTPDWNVSAVALLQLIMMNDFAAAIFSVPDPEIQII